MPKPESQADTQFSVFNSWRQHYMENLEIFAPGFYHHSGNLGTQRAFRVDSWAYMIDMTTWSTAPNSYSANKDGMVSSLTIFAFLFCHLCNVQQKLTGCGTKEGAPSLPCNTSWVVFLLGWLSPASREPKSRQGHKFTVEHINIDWQGESRKKRPPKTKRVRWQRVKHWMRKACLSVQVCEPPNLGRDSRWPPRTFTCAS